MPGRRAILLLSRRAGAGGLDLTGVVRRLEAHFRVVSVHRHRDPGKLAAAAHTLAREDDAVIVGGGDGTLNAVLSAVRKRRAVLGVLPLGTANDLARTLGLPLEAEAAAEILCREYVREIDLGRANDAFYLNVASLGLAVDVARRMNRGAKRALGPLAYPLAVADAIRAGRTFGIRVDGPTGRLLETRSMWLAVGNGRFYGGGTPISEDAAIDDGRLDLRSVRPQPLHRLLRLALAVRRGMQHRLDGVDARAGAWFRVETSRRQRVSVDGEVRTHTPVTFEVCPKALRVLAPEPEAS